MHTTATIDEKKVINLKESKVGYRAFGGGKGRGK